MAIEFTLAYFSPLLAFILVFVVVYGVLTKIKIFGDSAFIYSIIALVLALLFILSPLAKQYTLVTTPVLVVFLVSTFFILFIIGFVHGGLDDILKNPRVAQVVLVILLLIFIFSGIHVFGPSMASLLPGGNQTGLAPETVQFRDFIFHPSILAVILLFVVAALVAWAINK